MKFFISADLEGTNGVVSPGEIIPGELGYEAARILMTEEVNAAVRGLFDAGADEVLVCDSHEVAQNIRVDLLDERAFLLRGDCRPDSMVHSIDSSYDGLLLLGHHAMFGTQNAVLDHTYDQYLIREMKVNDTAYGEVGINALYAAEQGVPFIMASGDDALEKEAQAFCAEVEIAVVKYAQGRYSAKCLPRKAGLDLIYDKAKKAAENAKNVACAKIPEEITMEITFQQTVMADGAERVKGIVRKGPMTVAYKCASMKEYMEMRQVIFRAASEFYDSRF